MPEIELDGLKIDYDIRRSGDASRPRIDSKLGEIRVVIPEEQDLDPEELLEEKKSWVLKRKQEFHSFKRKTPERNFEVDEEFPYLGQKKKLKLGSKSKITGEHIIISENKAQSNGVKESLEELYREKAREIFEEKVRKYENQVENNHNRIFIRNQRTRWGSCSSKQNLNFNWRLLMAPEHVLEYVVVHELAHLDEKSHNEEFWSKVREMYPDYLESNRWLEKNSPELVFDREELFKSN